MIRSGRVRHWGLVVRTRKGECSIGFQNIVSDFPAFQSFGINNTPHFSLLWGVAWGLSFHLLPGYLTVVFLCQLWALKITAISLDSNFSVLNYTSIFLHQAESSLKARTGTFVLFISLHTNVSVDWLMEREFKGITSFYCKEYLRCSLIGTQFFYERSCRYF